MTKVPGRAVSYVVFAGRSATRQSHRKYPPIHCECWHAPQRSANLRLFRCLNCQKNAVVCEGYPPKEIWKSGKQKMEDGTALNILVTVADGYLADPFVFEM